MLICIHFHAVVLDSYRGVTAFFPGSSDGGYSFDCILLTRVYRSCMHFDTAVVKGLLICIRGVLICSHLSKRVAELYTFSQRCRKISAHLYAVLRRYSERGPHLYACTWM